MKIKSPAYTRKEYIHGMPPSKIAKYSIGSPSDKFGYNVSLISAERGMVKSDALEAVRISIGKILSTELGETGFCLTIRAHPHHIIRENKMLAFAGADRIQKGMRNSFGKSSKRAAVVGGGQTVLSVEVNENGLNAAKAALANSVKKLPMSYRVGIEKLN